MPLTRPVAGTPVVVEDFGQPVYDEIVRLQKCKWGVTTATSDASGYIVVAHGASFTPTGVLVTISGSTGSGLYTDTLNASSFRVRFYGADGSVMANTSHKFTWMVVG